MPPKAPSRLRKKLVSALEVIEMGFHYQTKVTQRGNPFADSMTFAELELRRRAAGVRE